MPCKQIFWWQNVHLKMAAVVNRTDWKVREQGNDERCHGFIGGTKGLRAATHEQKAKGHPNCQVIAMTQSTHGHRGWWWLQPQPHSCINQPCKVSCYNEAELLPDAGKTCLVPTLGRWKAKKASCADASAVYASMVPAMLTRVKSPSVCLHAWAHGKECSPATWLFETCSSCKPDYGNRTTNNTTEFLEIFAQEDPNKRLPAFT